LAAERSIQAQQTGKTVPILVKLAPDLSEEELESALEAIVDCGMDGVIVTNTTISRPPLRSKLSAETGGLSGAPLTALSLRMTARAVELLGGRLPVVSSGGIMNAQDAQRRLDVGASLIQLYSGLIYSGPGLVKEILDAGMQVPRSS